MSDYCETCGAYGNVHDTSKHGPTWGGRVVEVIRIVFTSEDVFSIAEDNGIDPDLALERAMDWGKHIAETMSNYCTEQLESVIRFNAP